jgi:hypothetical protein
VLGQRSAPVGAIGRGEGRLAGNLFMSSRARGILRFRHVLRFLFLICASTSAQSFFHSLRFIPIPGPDLKPSKSNCSRLFSSCFFWSSRMSDGHSRSARCSAPRRRPAPSPIPWGIGKRNVTTCSSIRAGTARAARPASYGRTNGSKLVGP